jgi:RNA polymerase sigma-70 factor (ECF subfamily)
MSASPVLETPSDHALATAYRAGDEGAAAELVRRHAPAVGRFLYSSGAPKDEIDDLVQEALFRAFRRLDGWRGEASFRSWLFAIAGNVPKDQYRRRKGLLMVGLEDRDLPDRADPHADLTAAETFAQLRRGVASLPRLQREVFLLRTQQGIGYAEIAAALGTTPGAARVHYHHAVKRLKELLR